MHLNAQHAFIQQHTRGEMRGLIVAYLAHTVRKLTECVTMQRNSLFPDYNLILSSSVGEIFFGDKSPHLRTARWSFYSHLNQQQHSISVAFLHCWLRYMRHAFGVFWSCNSLHPPPPSNKEDEPFSADETGGLP